MAVILHTAEDARQFTNAFHAAVSHFGSQEMANKYFDGAIDWHGRNINDWAWG
jgi:hypothetical protein